MRILFVTFGFFPQHHGVAHVANELAIRWRDMGHQVTVATALETARQSMPPLPGIAVQEFDLSGNGNPRDFYRGDINQYMDFIAGFPCDIIVCSCWQNAFTDLAFHALRKSKVPLILSSQGVSATLLSSLRLLPNFLCWIPHIFQLPAFLRRLNALVVPSNMVDMGRFFDRWLANKLDYRPVFNIPNGVDSKRFEPAANANPDSKTLLLVSGFSDMKNQRMAIEAVSLLPFTVKLILAGPRTNQYSRELENEWHSLIRNGSQVIFAYGCSNAELVGLYASATICLCCSRTEYFPLILLESMASRRAFISTDVGCARDLPGGVIIHSTTELAQSIEQLLKTPDLREQLAHSGREAAIKLYDWDNIAAKYLSLMTTLLKEHQPNSYNSSSQLSQTPF